jgi:hypothetical protein
MGNLIMRRFASCLSWLRRVVTPAPIPRHRLAFRPALEALEAREVPAVFFVTNTLDSGNGSLRTAIALANATPSATSSTSTATARSTALTWASSSPASAPR